MTDEQTVEFCLKCGTDRSWIPTKKDPNYEKCQGCGDYFPCKYSCSHLDCAQRRAETTGIRAAK